MDKGQAQSIICDFHARKIEISNGEKLKNCTVQRIIPIRMRENGKWQHVHDVEILTDKDKNHYFSIDAIMKGTSGVKGLKVGEIDFKVKGRMSVISHAEDFTDQDWIDTGKFVLKIKDGIVKL